MEKYRVRIGYDEGRERPDEYELGRMVSFSTRHANYQDPDTIDKDDVLAVLDYYEHGLCKWSLSGTGPSCPWDSVSGAGVIVWNGDESEREWWKNGLTDDDRRKILRGIAEDFTAWANGECYYYAVEKVTYCSECGTEQVEVVDSRGGFVGSDFGSVWSEYGGWPEDLEVVGP